MLEQERVSKVRLGQIRLPAPLRPLCRQTEPVEILFATFNVASIVVSDLNRSLLRMLIGDEHGNYCTINHSRLAKLVE